MNTNRFFAAMVAVITVAGAAVYAAPLGMVEALVAQHPINIDGNETHIDLPMLSADDRTYMQIRDICNIFGSKVKWNEESRTIEITTDPETIEAGYYGGYDSDDFEGKHENYALLGRWVSTREYEVEISEETALAVAEDIFKQATDEKSYTEAEPTVYDSNEEPGCYEVSMYGDNETENNITVFIRKADCKIVRIVQ